MTTFPSTAQPLSWKAPSCPLAKLPLASGISLKPQHYDELLEAKDNRPSWLELHPENYMGAGGAPHYYLNQIREQYPISMHGVGMSLGSKEPYSQQHLQHLKQLVDHYQPEQISEHIAWSHWNAHFFNDLLPLPYNDETLKILCENIDRVQSTLKRTILVENPSTYIDFSDNGFSEQELLKELNQRTGCGLLLDVNNIYVCAQNHNFSADDYIKDFPLEAVGEIHLAGHSIKPLVREKTICIDDHGSKVSASVWKLYQLVIEQAKRPIPTLIEWDTDVPELDVLVAESKKSDKILSKLYSQASV